MMNNIDKLITDLCPEGVEFKELGKVAEISGAGVDKKSNPNETPVALLNFMDVYKNHYLDKSIPTMKVTANKKKVEQCNILAGDIFITPSSEVLNDIGNSAVAVEDMPDVVYSYHIMRIRISSKSVLMPYFLNYIFESVGVQEQINRQAKGITRYGLTKTQWEQILVPIPPPTIQQEIVNILDTFTELEAELEARKKQYEFYRDELLTFGEDLEWKTLGEVCEMKAGKSISASDISSISSEENSYPCIGGNGSRGYVNSFSHDGKYSIIGRQGALCGNVCFAEGRFYATEHAVVVKHGERFIARFLYHLLFSMNLNQYATGGALPGLAVSNLNKIKIPIPPLSDQERIVSILDKFDALVHDLPAPSADGWRQAGISVGLPAEIAARRKQYEYYREKLLTFQEKQ